MSVKVVDFSIVCLSEILYIDGVLVELNYINLGLVLCILDLLEEGIDLIHGFISSQTIDFTGELDDLCLNLIDGQI